MGGQHKYLRKAALLSSALLLACGGEKSADKPAAATPQAVQKPKADFSGVIRGVVKLAPELELPLAPEPQTKPVDAPAPCPPYSGGDRKLFTMVSETRGISPVHVALTQMTAVPAYEAATRELTIDGCRLAPPLVGAVAGDTLRVLNRSETSFMPVLPGDTFMKSLLKGESREVQLKGLGPARISCGVSGYCGEAIVIALSHPLFDVTNGQGEFTIKGVPLEQDLVLHAGHPLVGTTSAPVRLTKAEPERTVELTLTPREPSPKPAAEVAKPQPGDKPRAKKTKPLEPPL